MKHHHLYRKLLLAELACVLLFVSYNYWNYSTVVAFSKTFWKTTKAVRRRRPGLPEALPVIANLSTHPRPETGLSDCSLADLQNNSRVMLLTTTNTAFLDITLNMIESIRRADVCVNTTIVAEDNKAYRYLRKIAKDDVAVHIMRTNSGVTSRKKLMWNTTTYNMFVTKRHAYTLSLLRRGFHVLFCDSDNFWFRDPFRHFMRDFDIAMFDEKRYYPKRHQNNSLYCSGFAYYKRTPRTIKFLERWVENLKKDPTIPDQDVMNAMLRADEPIHLKIRSLNPAYFPGGMLFYRRRGWVRSHQQPVVVHSTSILGHDNKVKRYKQGNMWLVDPKFLKSKPAIPK